MLLFLLQNDRYCFLIKPLVLDCVCLVAGQVNTVVSGSRVVTVGYCTVHNDAQADFTEGFAPVFRKLNAQALCRLQH